MKIDRTLLATLLLLLLMLLVPELASACPSCKETVRSQDTGSLAAGFSYTVYGMIGMVFGLVATVATVIVRAYRKGAGNASSL